MASAATHPLQHAWAIWEIRPYSTSKYYKDVCEFDTVEKFWECWRNLPKCSEVFGDGTKKVTVGGAEIKSMAIFKKGVTPLWEDKANLGGFQLEALRAYNVEAMDVQWENLVLGLIGEVVDEDDNVCGARVVNHHKKGKPHQYKVEVWTRRKDVEMASRLKAKLGEILCDVDPAKPHYKLAAEEFTLEKRH